MSNKPTCPLCSHDVIQTDTWFESGTTETGYPEIIVTNYVCQRCRYEWMPEPPGNPGDHTT